jgi:hypothetical protein
MVSMTKDEVREWVIEVAGSGVSHIWLEVDKSLCEGTGPDNVETFINTCKEINDIQSFTSHTER